MALETATYINGLVIANPDGLDDLSQGDDHIRLLKSTVKATFPLITTPWNASSVTGTVSQSAGVPTGAIIERGSNANGQYTKFADGTMIVWVGFGSISCTTASGAVFISAEIAWTFPAAFSVVPMVLTSAANLAGVLGFNTPLTTSTSFKVFSPVSGTANAISGVAIGRWF